MPWKIFATKEDTIAIEQIQSTWLWLWLLYTALCSHQVKLVLSTLEQNTDLFPFSILSPACSNVLALSFMSIAITWYNQ